MNKGNILRDIELRLLSELMKNSRRSDRELAKVLRISQPTVSRVLKRLEKEGFIKGFTIIPDFSKIGFQIMSFTFARLKKPLSPEELQEARKGVNKILNKERSPALLGMTGEGLDSDRVLVTLHEDYAAHLDFQRFIREQPIIEVGAIHTFLVDLSDKNHFLPLNFAGLAGQIMKEKERLK
jgi:DNA-binding Lrp family transcriptional regulator